VAAVELGAEHVLFGEPPRPAGVEHLVLDRGVLARPGQVALHGDQQPGARHRREQLSRVRSEQRTAVLAADREVQRQVRVAGMAGAVDQAGHAGTGGGQVQLERRLGSRPERRRRGHHAQLQPASGRARHRLRRQLGPQPPLRRRPERPGDDHQQVEVAALQGESAEHRRPVQVHATSESPSVAAVRSETRLR
jgi:hypothetical protein